MAPEALLGGFGGFRRGAVVSWHGAWVPAQAGAATAAFASHSGPVVRRRCVTPACVSSLGCWVPVLCCLPGEPRVRMIWGTVWWRVLKTLVNIIFLFYFRVLGSDELL